VLVRTCARRANSCRWSALVSPVRSAWAMSWFTAAQAAAAEAPAAVLVIRHAKGLLPEPERDQSGYRRDDAAAVVELIRIRTLAEAGVPLSRVQEPLTADEKEFAAAVEDIEHRLRAEIRERQRHRERVAKLAAGDRLALAPEAVDYLDRLREFGVPERGIAMEPRRLSTPS